MTVQQTFSTPYTSDQLQWVRETFFVSEPLARLLLARGLTTHDQIYQFLNPESVPDGDPFALSGMDKAVAVIRDVIANNEKICVYGDYDADGICATAILGRCLRALGANAHWFIPNRRGEGYGVSPDRVKTLFERGVTCLITVDNGITAIAEIAYAKSLGMRVVVTDHHRAGETLPPADAIVCASLDGYAQRQTDLCGAGVAWFFARALGCESERDWCLPLVALATVADMVRLAGENRKLVREGMTLIGNNVGLLALQRAAGVAEGACDEGALGFILGPRLNVAGRMGDASRALRLLLCEDRLEADRLARELEAENRRRKAEETRIAEDAERMLAEAGELPPSLRGEGSAAARGELPPSLRGDVGEANRGELPPVIVLYGRDWNTGVMGIVASRLVDRYYRPVLLFADRNGEVTGSGRSIPEVDLHDLLTACADHLVRFGGHAGAAGMTVLEENLPALRQRAGEWLLARGGGVLPVKTRRYDLALRPEDCTLTLCRELTRLAPFGRGNEEPIFLLPNAPLSGVSAMGAEGKHLRANLGEGGGKLRLVAFGEGEKQRLWQGWERADALVRLRVNAYGGTQSVNAYHVFLEKSKALENS